MSNEALLSRISFVVFGDDCWRVKIDFKVVGSPEIIYDAHGQTVLEARRTIRNIANIVMAPITLIVIHGYRHGTAIKEMLAEENFSGRLICRYSPEFNPGETFMEIAA